MIIKTVLPSETPRKGHGDPLGSLNTFAGAALLYDTVNRTFNAFMADVRGRGNFWFVRMLGFSL